MYAFLILEKYLSDFDSEKILHIFIICYKVAIFQLKRFQFSTCS